MILMFTVPLYAILHLYISADAVATEFHHFGEGSGFIFLDEVGCDGSETSLIQCNHPEFASNNCSHIEDAGVICADGRLACSKHVLSY